MCDSQISVQFKNKNFGAYFSFAEFFTGDLSALISLIVSRNVRHEKVSIHKKVIDSIEDALKGKFKTLKCHLIGSHVYNIAKGGLAPLDIYLDLRE